MYQILQKFDMHWHDGGPSIAMMYHLRRVSDLLCNWKSCLLCYMKDVVLHCSIFFKWNKLVRVRVPCPMYMHICIHIHIHTATLHALPHVHAHTHTRTHTHTHSHISMPCPMYMHIHIHTATSPCLAPCTCTYAYTYTYTQPHLHALPHVHAHTHTRTHTHSHISMPCPRRWYILNKFCCYVHHMNFYENFLRNDQEKFWTCCLHSSDLTYIHMRTNQHQWMLQCHWHRSVFSLKSVIDLLKRWQSHFQNESFYFQFADINFVVMSIIWIFVKIF